MSVLLTPAEVAHAQRVHINTVYNRLAEDGYEGVQRVGAQYRIPAEAIGFTDEQAEALISRMERKAIASSALGSRDAAPEATPEGQAS